MSSLIKGNKGGGQPKPPREDPDTLQSHDYANVLHLMGAGPIEGPVSVFVDDVPLVNADGTSNFPGYALETRLGTQDQTYIPGFASVQSETFVQQEIKAGTPITRLISNASVNFVDVRVKVPALVYRDEGGNRMGTDVSLTVEIAKSGGGFYRAANIVISGKTKSPFVRETRITLPPDGAPWSIRVTRNTADSTSDSMQNATALESYGEIIDTKYRYPNCALVGLEIDSQYSSGTRNIEFEANWRVVKVPSNYDAKTRVYTGVWDGTFKPSWTDCPPWIIYDVMTDTADGLGEFLPSANVDKWELYRIAQYCDAMIDDGFGGKEPRYTFNGEISGRSDAYSVLKDLAGACGCVTYWDGSTVRFSQDRPADDDMPLFTPSNVIDGTFTYQGASQKARHTVALVEYRDKEDGYQKKVEYVQDEELIARWGIVQTQITAFGCTSRGQAHRAGMGLLITEATESEMIGFATGMEGAFLYPGRVVKVADPVRSGVRHGGRIASATIRTITLDKAPEQTLTGVRTISIITSEGAPITRTVSGIVGNLVTVTADIPSLPVTGAQWVMQGANVAPTLWRVMSVAPDKDGVYAVSALAHNPSKYAAIENGIALAPPPPSLVPDVVPPAVTGLAVSQANRVDPTGRPVMDLDISWTPIAGKGVRGYAAQWRRNGDNWNYLPEQAVPFLTVEGVTPGDGEIVAWAVGRTGVSGPVATVAFGIDNPSAKPPKVLSFTATGAMMAVNLAWRYDGDIGHLKTVEIYAATTANGTPVKLADLSPGTTAFVHNGVSLGQRYWYWLYITDVYGNRSDQAQANGECIKDPSILLEQLNGSIGYNELDAELNTTIEKIDITSTQLGKIDEALVKIDGFDATLEDVGKIQAALDKVSGIEDLDANIDYLVENAFQGILNDDTQFRKEQTHGDNIALVQTDVKVLATDTEALAQRVDTVVARVDTNTASIQTVTQAYADADAALSSRIDSVTAKSDANTASITSVSKAYADADQALSARIDTVSSATASNEATIQSVSQTLTTADSAISARIDTVQSTVNGHTASIQTNSQAIDGVKAQYTLKVTAGGKVGGMGIYTDETGSVVDFLADKFFVSQPNGDGSKQVFSVGEINGVSSVGVNGQLIVDGTVSANTIVADGLYSTNYAEGVAGWKIAPDGTAELNNGIFRGELAGATGTFAGRLAAGVIDANAFSGITFEYKTAGTFTVTVPSEAEWQNVSCRVTLVGGGGGGGGSGRRSGQGTHSSGAGGGYSNPVVATITGLVKGATYQVEVGDGGAGGSGQYDSYGGGGAMGSSSTGFGYTGTGGNGGAGGNPWVSTAAVGGSIGGGKGSVSAIEGIGTGAGGAGGVGVYNSGGKGGDAIYKAPQAGAKGSAGFIRVEFFDPNTVVLNNRYQNLILWLDGKVGTVPDNAR